MGLSLHLQTCDHFLSEHFLLQEHQVSAFEEVETDPWTLEVRRREQTLLIAGQDHLGFLVVEASASLEKVELGGNCLPLAIGQLRDMFERNQHILAHNGFLPQRNLLLLVGDSLTH
jgi:hypothetical protein